MPGKMMLTQRVWRCECCAGGMSSPSLLRNALVSCLPAFLIPNVGGNVAAQTGRNPGFTQTFFQSAAKSYRGTPEKKKKGGAPHSVRWGSWQDGRRHE